MSGPQLPPPVAISISIFSSSSSSSLLSSPSSAAPLLLHPPPPPPLPPPPALGPEPPTPTAPGPLLPTHRHGDSALNQQEKELQRRLRHLYPAVDEQETPLPEPGAPRAKVSYIGLSLNNLWVHYKGTEKEGHIPLLLTRSPLGTGRIHPTVTLDPGQKQQPKTTLRTASTGPLTTLWPS